METLLCAKVKIQSSISSETSAAKFCWEEEAGIFIAQRLNYSASSVLNYTARIHYAGVDSLDQLNALSDVQLHDIIYKQGKCLRSCKKESLTIKQLSDNLTQSSSVLQPDYQRFANEYFDRHRKVQFLYTEYLEQCTEQSWGCGQNPGLKPGVKNHVFTCRAIKGSKVLYQIRIQIKIFFKMSRLSVITGDAQTPASGIRQE